MDHDSVLQKKLHTGNSLKQRNMLLSMRLNNTPMGRTRKSMISKPKSSSTIDKNHLTKIPSPRKSLLNSPTKLEKVRNDDNSKIPSPVKSSIPYYSPVKQQSPIKYNDLKLEDFEIGKKLGKGKFGRVYCVKHKKTGFICALKAMEKKEIIQYNIQKQFRREVEIQASLNHPNLTKLYGYFHDEKRVYLVMEYLVNGELYRYLKQNGPFNDSLASYYVYQMADALDYMHKSNILHRDIKPENILIGFHNIVKLTDFGWGVMHTKGSKRKTLCGTIDYLSPELIKSREYDEKVDVWALGVLTYELLVGAPPFEESSKELTYKRILKREIRFPQHVPIQAQNLISRLMEYDPALRIPLSEVKKHPWILKYKQTW